MAEKTLLMRGRLIRATRPICALAVVLFLVVLECARAQFVQPETGLARSLSGQFVVRAAGAISPGKVVMTNQDLVHLEPSLVTVSCERIKQLLLRELNAGNAWRGKIYLGLVPSDKPGQPVTILSERFRSSWQYRVELPDVIERARYVRTIVHVLLLEFANRTDGNYPAEIPVWLSEGFAQMLLASNELEIILPPPRVASNGLKLISSNVSARKNNPVEIACAKLKSRSPLSFYELSWPVEEGWSVDAAEVYRGSAQLFVHELMQLKEGRGCLRVLLSKLPQRLNWQLAFLDSFHSYFSRAVDVEKWWALQVVRLGRRDILQQTWSFEESQQKLDEALHASLQIHTGTNDLPLHTTVSLSAVIRDSNHLLSSGSLHSKVRELDLLRSRITPEFIPLLDKYRQILDTYLQRLDKSAKKAPEREMQETLAQLEELDALRALVRPRQKSVASSQP